MNRTSPWSRLRSARGLRNLALTGAAATASAGLGALATTPESDWYADLDTPSWQPPPIAFPLVWTPLYADIAVVSAAVLTTLEGEGRNDAAAAFRKALALNLALNLVLVRVMGFAGLALGTTIAALFNAAALTFALDRRIGGLERAQVTTALVKVTAASIAMGIAAVLVARWSGALLPGDATAISAVRVVASIGTGMAVLVIAARLLRIAEFDEARKQVVRRFVPR